METLPKVSSSHEKTVVIEHVENGWVVRPFSPCDFHAGISSARVWVFTDMACLQRALPSLLEGPHLIPTSNQIANEPL